MSSRNRGVRTRRRGETADGKGMSVIIHHQTEEGRSWRAGEATSVTARAGDRDPDGRLGPGERPCSAALCFWHRARSPVTCAPPCSCSRAGPSLPAGSGRVPAPVGPGTVQKPRTSVSTINECTGDDWSVGSEPSTRFVACVRAWNNEVATVQCSAVDRRKECCQSAKTEEDDD